MLLGDGGTWQESVQVYMLWGRERGTETRAAKSEKKGRKKVSGGETGRKRNGATLTGPVPRTPSAFPARRDVP